MKNEILSVGITAYSQHEITVVHAREAIYSNRTPDEIIIVNDGGDPCLRDMLKEMYDKTDKRCPLIYARIDQDILWNYPGGCNLITWISRGDYICFEDNDNIPHRDFYGEAIKKFKEYPEVGRICSTKRIRIWKKNALSKPYEEWQPDDSGIGPNMGTAMIRRDLVVKLKGQDERLSGSYGFMFIDWRHRMMAPTKGNSKFGNAGFYWYIMDGQTELSRDRTSRNLQVRRENCRSEKPHSEHGILNFTFTYEKWT